MKSKPAVCRWTHKGRDGGQVLCRHTLVRRTQFISLKMGPSTGMLPPSNDGISDMHSSLAASFQTCVKSAPGS